MLSLVIPLITTSAGKIKIIMTLSNVMFVLVMMRVTWHCQELLHVVAQQMAEALCNNSSMKAFRLIGYNISDFGAKALAEVLNCNTILKELDLSRNKIGDVGAIALAQALHSNSSLEVLELFRNCIGDSGAEAFAEALHHNSTITHLNLSWNEDIGEEGVHHLIQALTVNDSISENGLRLGWKQSEYALNCSGYQIVEHKIEWW